MKIQKNGGSDRGGGSGRGVRLDVNEELKFFVKIKKKIGGGGRVGSGRRSVWGCQGGCERRIEMFEKIHKNKIRGGGGVRVGRGVFGLGVFRLGGPGWM